MPVRTAYGKFVRWTLVLFSHEACRTAQTIRESLVRPNLKQTVGRWPIGQLHYPGTAITSLSASISHIPREATWRYRPCCYRSEKSLHLCWFCPPCPGVTAPESRSLILRVRSRQPPIWISCKPHVRDPGPRIPKLGQREHRTVGKTCLARAAPERHR